MKLSYNCNGIYILGIKRVGLNLFAICFILLLFSYSNDLLKQSSRAGMGLSMSLPSTQEPQGQAKRWIENMKPFAKPKGLRFCIEGLAC